MLRTAWESLGLSAATPVERQFAIWGGAIFLAGYLSLRMAVRAMFGWLWRHLPRRKRSRKRKGRRR